MNEQDSNLLPLKFKSFVLVNIDNYLWTTPNVKCFFLAIFHFHPVFFLPLYYNISALGGQWAKILGLEKEECRGVEEEEETSCAAEGPVLCCCEY